MKPYNYKWHRMSPPQRPSGCPEATEDRPCHIVQNGGRFRKPKSSRPRPPKPLRVQRYFCKTHRRSLTWIPTALLPHLHYEAPVVNAEVRQYVEGSPLPSGLFGGPHPKTVRRWIGRFTQQLARLPNQVYQAMGIAKKEKENDEWLPRHEFRVKLLQIWSLLKLLAETQDEKRVPYHYVYGFSRSP